ncbi:MAG TPA: DUF5938 domain-containing protein [Acidimicrobiia bacterium]|nr:DUF5938 domain-containing protein [Acidimicrobiia bacterium]
MSTKPVVVYGASGYTGRLVCEYLREHNIGFVAAGRSKDRLASAMERNVPGIETADYEIAEVEHSAEGLTKLLAGSKVLINTVGPFAQFGHEAVQACLSAGCHYTDTTGEQDWMIECDEKYGQEFANAGLLLSPGIAQMYTTGEIAAQIALEQLPGLHTLDIEVFWKGAPTLASTATILVNAALAKAHYLEENQYVEWPADAGLYQVVVPGQHELGLALPWGGTSHPVWFKNDPRVQNCKVLGGIINRPLMMAVPGLVAAILEGVEGLELEQKLSVLHEQAGGVTPQMPPRENPRINISIDSVHASGPLGRVHTVIYGNCNYKQTGLLNAYAASQLIQGGNRAVGFASACQAFGHKELFGVLKSFGLVQDPVIAVNA